jgi:hypothetical protein
VSRIERKERLDNTRRAGTASFVIRGLEETQRCVRVRLSVVRMKMLRQELTKAMGEERRTYDSSLIPVSCMSREDKFGR